ncbi:MAG: HsdM family class I SAM-dependent methyltransferase [Candidatus Bathyarchaeales archaeon]
MMYREKRADNLRERLSAQGLRLKFGIKSQTFPRIVNELQSLWKRVKHDQSARLKFESWKDRLKIVYGYEPGEDLFIIHTYLATLVKLVLYFKLAPRFSTEAKKLVKVIDGTFFNSHGLLNFVEDDFSAWTANSEVIENSCELFSELAQRLSQYNFSCIDEDFFKEIYEEMIERGERHKAGEYYTPEWLSQLILREVLKLWDEDKKDLPRILDPACGSGTFLCNAIRLFKTRFEQRGLISNRALNEILSHIVGMDINPLACMLSKANYIIALGELVKKSCLVSIPIYAMDALEPQADIGKFDILVGNPPWLVMRSIENRAYQDYLKRESTKYKLLNKNCVHLFTQMEMATLFFCKTSDLYLENKGIIGFVMPRSVIGGTIQHIGFRRFERPLLRLIEILDLAEVQPLFNMPSCVLIATKSERTVYPVLAKRYEGELPKKNAKLNEIESLFTITKYEYFPPEFPAKPSYYFAKFKVGASIFPRTFYFIDINSQINNALKIYTSKDIFHMSKAPWRVELEGTTEPKFVYATLLAWEMIPFGYVKLRPVILPIESFSDGYKLFDPNALESAKFIHAAEWFRKAQKIWEERRTGKSEQRFPKLIDRLDYNGLLTSQQPRKRYIVLYNATGTNLVSCVIDRLSLPAFKFQNGEINPAGFVVDVKTWFYETNDEMEAYYLSSIFNSDVINKIIKPLQPRGLFGARAIHRRPLLFKIPKFDVHQSTHSGLSEIAKSCHEDLERVVLPKNKARRHVRKNFKEEIAKINDLVLQLLEGM